MLKDKDCTIFLTLAGSTSAAGCMNIYKDLVKYNMVDAIVATGASIVDMDFFEALGFKHYQGSQFQDDTELRNNYIDEINTRSSHSSLATRTGGISLFSTLFLISVYFYLTGYDIYEFSILIPLSILATVGLYDDIHGVDFKLKFIF